MVQGPPAATREELIERARRLAPGLRERVARAEAERCVPAETIAEFQRAGLLHALKPARYGGYEFGTFELASIAMEVARHCAASGWVCGLFIEHSWCISTFSEEAQDEVWGDDGYRVASASFHPEQSQAVRVPGGYRVSGRWPFSSGCDHAHYVLVNAYVDGAGEAGSREQRTFLIPQPEITIDDNWFVLGLRGTGSRTLVGEDLFVPEYRTLSAEDLALARGPGVALHPNFTLLRAPRTGVAPFTLASTTVGIALGAVDSSAELAREAGGRRPRIVESEAMQLKLSESAAEAFAARLLVERATGEAMQTVGAGRTIGREQQVRFLRDCAFAGLLAVRAVDRLHTAFGSGAIFDGHPLQRALRDVHTAIAQSAMHWEQRALPYARYQLGLERNGA